jgi:hypothetical protein
LALDRNGKIGSHPCGALPLPLYCSMVYLAKEFFIVGVSGKVIFITHIVPSGHGALTHAFQESSFVKDARFTP